MADSSCPAADQLARFAVGNLGRADFTRIADHVERCAACVAVVQSLDQTADPLLERLRQSATVPTPAEPVPADWAVTVRAFAARPPDAPETPRRLGKFELLEELGSGSFGQVFRARDTELGRPVAIKLLRAGRFATRDEVDRFQREARATAQLKHPGIVAVYDTAQTTDGAVYLVEEFIAGATLDREITSGRWNARRSAGIVAEIADALAFAHRHGVIHRDIKPSNIILDAAGRPHLMDFGLAKREGDDSTMTVAGQLLGTPAYMSPEQARGEAHHVDARSDIYSLGVILYELLTGERPFRGNRRMLLLQVLQDEPRAPRRLNDQCPRDLEIICLKALAKTPARRYAGAQELADDLRRWLAGEPIRARPVGVGERIWRWSRRNPLAASLLVALSLGLVFGVWYLSRLAEELVRTTSIASAAQQSEMLDQVNNIYSAEVVNRLGDAGVQATHDYRLHPGAIPLPATLTIELGKTISERGKSGMQVRLYSDYPFRSRPDGGPKDDFEHAALRRLRENPDEPVAVFEEVQGELSLRYATARRMTDTCVQCHNQHPDSTKQDWKAGDVRGVLEIIRPLEQDKQRAREGLRGTVVLMALIYATLLGLFTFGVLGSRRGHGAPERSGP